MSETSLMELHTTELAIGVLVVTSVIVVLTVCVLVARRFLK